MRTTPSPTPPSTAPDKDVDPITVPLQDIRSPIRFRPIKEKIQEYIDRSIAMYDQDASDESDEEEGLGEDEGQSEETKVLGEDEGQSEETEVLSDEGEIQPSWEKERVVEEFKFGVVEFQLLVEKLPRGVGQFRVKYELLDGFLHIRTVPGHLHGRACGHFSQTVTDWSINRNATGSARYPLRDFNDSNYQYRTGRVKIPDASFIPRAIQIPPAKAQPNTVKPGYTGLAFPTIVFEVAHTNETWQRLIRDGHEKAFARMTSVQVLVAVKLYKRHMRAFWGKRRHQGRAGMTIMRTTDKLRMDRPIRQYFMIPTALIFWGCRNIPAHVPAHLRLGLEGLQQELQDFM